MERMLEVGVQHHRSGRLLEAEKTYRQILESEPNNVTALNRLGALAGQIGHITAFLDLARRVVEMLPDNAKAHYNLGLALSENGYVDDSLVHFAKALEIEPGYVGAFRAMGTIYMQQGLQDQALQCYRQALRLDPDAVSTYSNLLYVLHFRSQYDARMLLAEHRQWADRYERPLASERRPHENAPNPDRRLRIGYVSSGFCRHVVAQFLFPLLAHHDHRLFEICCYSGITTQPDTMTRRLQKCADRWQETVGMSDAELAEQIRKDRIDVLVDLDQHTGGNRLLVFARKPAPVQVAWLGYPCTTGLEAMDYRLTDPYLDPPGSGDENYSEKSLRLPHCFWCYAPPDDSPPVGPLPAEENSQITFGCLNRFDKVSEPALQLWRRVLHAVPQSRLLIHSKIGDHLDAVRRGFEREGIAARRLEFVERKPMLDYLREYGRIDIGLDPFPHGGGTVTCDALWMGVPVVTLSGATAVGRGGTSLLSNVGLPELIARTPEQYVATAVGLAANLEKLQELRANLRSRMQSSALMDAGRFTADMEAAYRQMWNAR
jgi:protein O-GlcNAc transferase